MKSHGTFPCDRSGSEMIGFRRGTATSDRLAFEVLEARNLFSGTVLGSADATGVLTLSATSPQGAVVLFQEIATGAATKLVGVEALLGTPKLDAPPATWADPRDGFTYGAAPSSKGLIIFRQLPGGAWSWRNISEQLGTPGLNNLTVFKGQDGSVNIVGVQTDGDVSIVHKDSGDWAYKDLSDDLRSQGISTPVFTSRLASYVTAWDARNIVGLDAHGDVRTLWWAPGMSKWREDNLSAITGAPSMQGDITAYTLPWGHMAIVGLNAGRAYVTWWTPSLGAGNWQTSNLSDLTGAPDLRVGSISSFTTSWNAQNVVGLDSAGKLAVLWWAPGMTSWFYSSDLVPGAPAAGGPVNGIASPTGTINLVGLSPSGDVTRYYWSPAGDQTWRYENVSAVAVPTQPNLDSVPLDFLDVTGIGRAGGGRWSYHAISTEPANGPSGTLVGLSTPGKNNTFSWTPDASSFARAGTVVSVPHTTFQRRGDGVYLTSISAADTGGGDGISFSFTNLKLSPLRIIGSFSSSEAITIPIPAGMTGDVKGTVSLKTSRDDTELVSTPWGTVQTVKITMTIDITASGWSDDGEGDGPQYGSLHESNVITMNAIPGVGIVQVSETATATVSDSEGDDTQVIGMRAWLEHF